MAEKCGPRNGVQVYIILINSCHQPRFWRDSPDFLTRVPLLSRLFLSPGKVKMQLMTSPFYNSMCNKVVDGLRIE